MLTKPQPLDSQCEVTDSEYLVSNEMMEVLSLAMDETSNVRLKMDGNAKEETKLQRMCVQKLSCKN
jgi:hypothetical protein